MVTYMTLPSIILLLTVRRLRNVQGFLFRCGRCVCNIIQKYGALSAPTVVAVNLEICLPLFCNLLLKINIL